MEIKNNHCKNCPRSFFKKINDFGNFWQILMTIFDYFASYSTQILTISAELCSKSANIPPT